MDYAFALGMPFACFGILLGVMVGKGLDAPNALYEATWPTVCAALIMVGWAARRENARLQVAAVVALCAWICAEVFFIVVFFTLPALSG